MKARFVFIFLGLAFFVALSCSDDDTIVNGTMPRVNVSGTVYSWMCAVHDPNNNLNGGVPVTEATNERARVTFLPKNGVYYSDSTDDSSSYDWSIVEGVYDIIVETPFNWPPDTIKDVSINRDTTIDLDFLLDFLCSDTLVIEYFYTDAADSLGYDSEKHWINRLNQIIGEMMNINNGDIPLSWRTVYIAPSSEPPYAIIRYYIPIHRESYHLGFVAQKANEYLGMYNMEFPKNISAYPHGAYYCFW
ncbi:exported hypothetical protein [Candidatus Zixiibacteriota bacterium]|nr:exported hypothetical protein [candidate division Zixibacteria bacterium]